jgi:hypothetical protein
MTILAYVLHIGGGTIGLASGLVAAFARKGGYLHRKAGTVFVVSMWVMAAFAIYLAIALADQVNLFIGTFTLYLVATARMTVRRVEETSGLFEKVALIVALCLCAPFGILAFQLLTGTTRRLKALCHSKGLSLSRSISLLPCSRSPQSAMRGLW